ncbi:MAG: hypothetical protein LBL04_02935 [Bacteroidales bacterium]|nr:hypothetical protein [Bacteroidales bacterium]
MCFLLLSCSEKTQDSADEICGCENPQENLPWLRELIQKAETDKTGHYAGCIRLKKTSGGKDIFVTGMMLGSGGIVQWFFDCNGNHYTFPGVEKCTACEYVGNHHVFFDADFSISEKEGVLIHSPEGLPCE